MTSSQDIFTYGAIGLIISAMLIFPFILADMKREGSLELYLSDHKNLPSKESTTGFILSFGLRNAHDDDIPADLILGREDESGYSVLWTESIIIESGASKNFIYPVNQTHAGKYSITIPQTGQSIHFFVFKNNTYTKQDAGPDLFPDTPWELQDPILQEYYRYN
ncbi:MAG: hypothetical protein NDI94_03585 [Candidatus Woesearchaeota archaeon]|nr:hypothetical protein [Candidatus Woesearchaeota archaeon]